MKHNQEILSYTVAYGKKEVFVFSTAELNWQEARNLAIDKANEWKNASKSVNRYTGIRLWLTFGAKADPNERTEIKLLTGKRMHSREILNALWLEAIVLKLMGYDFEKTRMDFNGQILDVVNDKHVSLYYFTA